MNKSKVIGGIICLAIAGLLAVLTIVLPEDRMMFMIGDENVPIAPAIILGVIGIVLLITAGTGESATAQKATREIRQPVVQDEGKVVLNKRLEGMAWGFFLIMLGGFFLVPHEIVAKGLWSIGVGVIMLGLNMARNRFKIKMSGFTTFLGVISLISGITQLLGVQALEGSILLIVLGAYLIVKPWFDRQQVFGKAEQS